MMQLRVGSKFHGPGWVEGIICTLTRIFGCETVPHVTLATVVELATRGLRSELAVRTRSSVCCGAQHGQGAESVCDQLRFAHVTHFKLKNTTTAWLKAVLCAHRSICRPRTSSRDRSTHIDSRACALPPPPAHRVRSCRRTC